MLVLDTHIWIWWINQTPQRLPMEIVKLIEQTEVVAISAISCFELTWLYEHGRIHLYAVRGFYEVREWLVIFGPNGMMETAFPPDNIDGYLTKRGFLLLGPIEEIFKWT